MPIGPKRQLISKFPKILSILGIQSFNFVSVVMFVANWVELYGVVLSLTLHSDILTYIHTADMKTIFELKGPQN